MKILIVNTYYYLRGGAERLALDLGQLLKQHGHEIHYFAMKHRQNLKCADEKYFVDEIDYQKQLLEMKPFNFFKALFRSVYSIQARCNIAALLDDIKPDVVHLHAIRHHLTKSILTEFKKRDVPVVWTLHDYKELCPNTTFYNRRGICEECKVRKYRNVIRYRCKKDSVGASLITYMEAHVNDSRFYTDHITTYISPSQFLKRKLVEFGYDPEKIQYVPNFLDLTAFEPCYECQGDYLFLGRIEREKGILTLIRAFQKASADDQSMTLKIAGTGNLVPELENVIDRMEIKNVKILGFQSGKKLESLTREAKAIIIPSEWYENYPYSALESMAYGKPIIASRIGGIPEIVEDGVTGYLYEPFNEDDLSRKLIFLNRLPPAEISKLGENARKKVESINSSEIFLGKMMEIYKNAVT